MRVTPQYYTLLNLIYINVLNCVPSEEYNKKYCIQIDKLQWELTRDIYFGCLNVSFHTIRLCNLYTGLNFL